MFKSLTVFLSIFCFGGQLLAQDKKSCVVTKNLGGKYKLVEAETVTVENKKRFSLQIKLRPDKFNDDYLRRVARRIKETYCQEDMIFAEIWDISRMKRYDDLNPTPFWPPQIRAFYDLNRIKKEEKIQFVSGDGRSLGEVIEIKN